MSELHPSLQAVIDRDLDRMFDTPVEEQEPDEPPTLHSGLEDREPWSGGFAENH